MHFRYIAIPPALLMLFSIEMRAQDPPDTPTNYEVITRGPVHEAFAQPTDVNPESGPVAPKAPPEPVEEIPPDQKPDGDDVEWIPGYWAWDAEAEDFLWVSGFWRDTPPNRRWVPGTWQEADDGWHWTPGLWAPADTDALEYTPPPPESLDVGPSTAPPSETHIWIPGCWIWREARFYWRPGFWCPHYSNWVWSPPRYCWTPAGCIFVDGFWDRPCHLRGVLFAPIRVPPRILVAGFHFTPHHAVQADFLLTSLFVGPARRHFFFGDYFHDRYERTGFVPWIDFQPVRRVPDPIFGYYQVAYRRNPEWQRGLTALFRGRRDGTIALPPRTLVQQQQVINTITNDRTANVNVGRDLNITNIQNATVVQPITRINETEVTALASLAPTAAKTETGAPKRVIKLANVAKEQQTRMRERVKETRNIAKQRHDIEAKLLRDGGVSPKLKTERPPRLELPKDPTKVELPKKLDKLRPKAKLPQPPTVPKTEDRQPPKVDRQPRSIRPPAKKKETGGFPIPPKKGVTPLKKVEPPPKKVEPPPKKVKPRPKKDPPPKKAPPPKKKDKDKDGDGLKLI
jgi:hypothetical protein